MSSNEIRRIVVGVDAKTGWTFRYKDVCEILQYTEQKQSRMDRGKNTSRLCLRMNFGTL